MSGPLCKNRGCLLASLLIIISCLGSNAQSQEWSVGIRSQKSIKFYRENGISVYHSSDAIVSGKLLLGFHFVTSSLGTAFQTNAINQHSLFLSSHYIFRSTRKLNILTGVDLGWFSANYEEEIFQDLPNKAPILALEGGLRYHLMDHLDTNLTFGYHLTSGNGLDGPGTLYPVFYQISVLWVFKK